MTDEKKQEYTLRITQANRSQLLVILYEMTESYADDTIDALRSDDDASYKEGIRRIRGCINELMNTLDYRYSPSTQLLELYVYISRELISADLHKDSAKIEEIKGIIGKLKDAFAKASESDESAPLVDHAQQVYAGLTYGKHSLNESVMTQGAGCEFNA